MSGKQPKRKARPGVDAYGRTPLHDAALAGDLALLVQLIDSGSVIDAQDDNGWTPLHFAAQERHAAVAEELLRRGANHALFNSYGNGPLWVAMMNARGDQTVPKLLLAAGADADHKNNSGRSPRDIWPQACAGE